MSRGFGFLRFPTLDEAKAFVERNYPMIYLYGNNLADGDDSVAKVRIAFSRERDDRSRGERPEGEWICKIVSKPYINHPMSLTKVRTVYLFQFRHTREML